MAGAVRLVVARRVRAADDVVLLDLVRDDGGPLPRWAPGAHVDVVLPGGLGERQYSLCGDPADRGTWRIGVLREDGGRGGSLLLHSLAEGDGVAVRGPANHFAFRPVAGQRYLFVAGGIGITPIAAMVRSAEDAGADWRLVYAGRSRSSMAFVDELVGLGERVALFAGDEGVRADVAAELARDPDRVVYCCGPTRLTEAVERAADDRPAGHLHLERFTAKEFGEPVWSDPFEVELMLSGITVTVPPERTVLEAVEDAGVLALASCRVGTCGTCEVEVVEGDVEHRDSVLTPEEQDDNRVMMICVSRAACPRLVLEL